MKDQVKHPDHYNTGNIEVIEMIEDQFDSVDFHKGNAIKYTMRAGKKDPSKYIEDLKKAKWYLERAIEMLSAPKEDREPCRPNDMGKPTVDKILNHIDKIETSFKL